MSSLSCSNSHATNSYPASQAPPRSLQTTHHQQGAAARAPSSTVPLGVRRAPLFFFCVRLLQLLWPRAHFVHPGQPNTTKLGNISLILHGANEYSFILLRGIGIGIGLKLCKFSSCELNHIPQLCGIGLSGTCRLRPHPQEEGQLEEILRGNIGQNLLLGSWRPMERRNKTTPYLPS